MKSSALLATVLLVIAGCSGEPATEPTTPPAVTDTPAAKTEPATTLPSIVYYELNEVCPFCIRIRSDIGELEKEYEGRVTFSIIPCRSEEGVEAKARNGWEEYIHGLEARDATGALVGQIEGHQFSREDMVAKVKLALGEVDK